MTEREGKYPFTIGFITDTEKILMLKRVKEPNRGLWNGVGGKIEDDETPEESIIREVKEEVNIIVAPEQVQFGGTVSWDTIRNGKIKNSGMYVYVIPVLDKGMLLEQKQTTEGILEWKDKEWVMDMDNKEVVENIPYFLAPMLSRETVSCHCKYKEGVLLNVRLTVLKDREQ